MEKLVEFKILFNIDQYAGIYDWKSLIGMFKKIISKLNFGSCKSKISNDINTCKESDTKQKGRSE